MPFLYTLVILLSAAIIAVPLAKRFGFGSVLGYLLAGLIIGPGGLGLVRDVDSIAHVSELGVVMLLFLIGLELRPQRLWVMRRAVFGLGAAQVVVTAALLIGLVHLAGFSWPAATVTGVALAFSSTAIVLPMLAERDLLTSQAGRDGFGVLLFQDIAVIPAVALIPLLHGVGAPMTLATVGAVSVKALAALLIVLIGGRYLIRPIFRAVDRAKTPEIFTATALVVVGGTAALVNAAGLSMSLGAFMAGVLLSDSEYRHQLKADIEPFEGLLLGVFFISVGMAANLALLGNEMGLVLGAVSALILVKALLCFLLALSARQPLREAARFAFALAQAGEFGFVLLTAAVGEKVMTPAESELVMLVITISMVASPFLFSLAERLVVPRLSNAAGRPFDDIEDSEAPVIICGFGRMGQIVGRILRLRGIPFTALDKSAEQVDLVRRFGTQAYFGDPTRLELLRAAGAATAKLLVVTLEDVDESVQVVEHAQRHFPQLTILAAARNRRHVHLLMDRGVTRSVRETFHSSLQLTAQVLDALGVPAEEAKRTVQIFEERDERLLRAQHAYYRDEKQMIQTSAQVAEELRSLLEVDREQGALEQVPARAS